MSSFHFCLSAGRNLSSFHLIPISLMTDLLQLFLGLPIFLLPWGFHSRAAFGISPSSFLSVWPIHLSFLFLISKFISSWPFTVLCKGSLQLLKSFLNGITFLILYQAVKLHGLWPEIARVVEQLVTCSSMLLWEQTELFTTAPKNRSPLERKSLSL